MKCIMNYLNFPILVKTVSAAGLFCLCIFSGCVKDKTDNEPNPISESKDWRSVYPSSVGANRVADFVFANSTIGYLNIEGEFVSPSQGRWTGSYRTANGADTWASFYSNTGYSQGARVLPYNGDTAFSWISQGGPAANTRFEVTTNAGKQWNTFSNYVGAWVYDVALTGVNRLLALTSYGYIIEVTASGVTELAQLSIAYNYHTFFEFSNSIIGHLFTPDSVGNYVAYLTTDGGYNWSLQYQFSGGINDAAFTSPTEGFVCGDNGLVLSTIDGGQNWVPMQVGTTVNLNSICFTNDGRGYCVGNNGVFLTLEPGEVEWKQDIDFLIPESITKVQMFDSLHGYISTEKDLYKKG